MQAIRALGKKAGVTMNPATPVSSIEHVIDLVDLILIMSVNPGFGGQSFIDAILKKISALKRMISREKAKTLIEVDGGISENNAQRVFDAGADILVMGSAFFTNKDKEKLIRNLKSSK